MRQKWGFQLVGGFYLKNALTPGSSWLVSNHNASQTAPVCGLGDQWVFRSQCVLPAFTLCHDVLMLIWITYLDTGCFLMQHVRCKVGPPLIKHFSTALCDIIWRGEQPWMEAGRGVMGMTSLSLSAGVNKKKRFSCWKMTFHVSKWWTSECVTSFCICQWLGSGKINAQVTQVHLIFTFPCDLHGWTCCSALWSLWALMRRCVCAVAAMQGMLDHRT